jgi:hypothetical protein
MINSLILAGPLLAMLVVVVMLSLKPRLKPFSPEALRDTVDYHNRMNRRGVLNNPAHAAVTSFEVYEK